MLPHHPDMVSAYPFMLKARVHFLNALYAWISASNMTPHILVDTTMEGVQIPKGIDKDGRVVLNIAMRSANQLSISEDWITFGGSFGGKHFSVRVPMEAVLAIYARETGVGMGFPAEESPNAAMAHMEQSADAGVPASQDRPQLAAVPSEPAPVTPVATEADPPPPPTPRQRGHLRVIK